MSAEQSRLALATHGAGLVVVNDLFPERPKRVARRLKQPRTGRRTLRTSRTPPPCGQWRERQLIGANQFRSW